MDIAMFIYTILQIVLFTATAALGMVYYFRKRNPFYFMIAVLFSAFIMDLTVVAMTEFLESFGHLYDKTFMTVPAFKTFIYAVIAFAYSFLYNSIISKKIQLKYYIPVFVLAISLLFLPVYEVNTSLKVYIYYQLFTVFQLWISICLLSLSRKNHNHPAFSLKKLGVLTFVFSILIAIEDFIVIFYFDTYSSELVSIQNRCFSEDVFRIFFSFITCSYLVKKIHPRLVVSLNEYEPHSLINEETPQNQESTNSHSILDSFSNKYDLSAREKEILKHILDNKSSQEIADILFISIGTVKTHTHNFYQKMNIRKRNQLLQLYDEFSKQYNPDW